MSFDVESFCHSISLSLVARARLKVAYLPVLLRLALLTYAEVRLLTAGCAQGNHAARLAFCDILQKSHELYPSTTTAQWVDDLAQRTQSPPNEVVNKELEAALQLVRDLQEDKLAVASKSVVIATTPSTSKQVVSTLARHDIHIQEASSATMRRTVAKRWAKAGRRTRRCARFGKWTSKQASARLWSMGAASLWYGGCGGAADVDQAREDEGR